MSELFNLKLGYSNILNVPLDAYDKDFMFIVNNQEFKTSRLTAELLSPKICQIHSIDPTFDQIDINTKEKGDFSEFLKLVKFEPTKLKINELEFIKEIIEFLEIDSIEIIKADETNEITESNVFSLMQNHTKYRSFYADEIEKEIEFISGHFSELFETKKDELEQLDEQTLFDITKHEALLLKSEDQLLSFVNGLYLKNERYKFLYENVIFNNCSSSIIQEFINIFDLNDINSTIWKTLSIRLCCEIIIECDSKLNEKLYKDIEFKNTIDKSIQIFEYKEGKEFDGIISSIAKKCGGNPHDKGEIEVKSNCRNINEPKNLLDYDSDNFYATYNIQPDACITFDFKDKLIEISKYSIKSTLHDSNKGQIKNWVIEISSDGKQWTKIDEHSNYSGLNERGAIKTFNVQPNQFSRFFRFRHTGEYWGPNWALKFNSIEIFGKLKTIF